MSHRALPQYDVGGAKVRAQMLVPVGTSTVAFVPALLLEVGEGGEGGEGARAVR